jgi:DNA polymerase-3 subunit epsilon
MAGGGWKAGRALRAWFATGHVAEDAPPLPLPAGPIAAQRYVVFDLETTGLHPSRDDAIVQVGAVRLEAGEETASFATLVNPGRRIPAVSTRYHGITDAMVADAPPVAEALAAFRDFAEGAVLVAHNAAFDLTALRAAARDGAPVLRNPALCTMMLADWLDPAQRDVRLDSLCARHGIAIDGRHQALGDARATAALWRVLMAQAAARGIAELPELAARSRMAGRIADQARHF